MQWHGSSKILTRTTFTVLDLFKDVGGFSSFLLTLFSIVIPFFGDVKILGLLASSAYVRSRKTEANQRNTLDRF
jgi:hypothetical protein